MHVYALGHIAYYKWKHCRQDNQVHIFYITPEVERDAEGQQRPNSNQNLNTRAYNKLLFEVKTIIGVAIFLITKLLTAKITGNLQEGSNGRALPIIYFIQDWMPGLLANVIFPFYFYKCNREARMYFKQMFCKC